MAITAQYKGMAFPFQKKDKEIPATATDEELIKQSIIQIVMTSRNSRVFRPDFGSDAMSFIFENNDAIRAELFKNNILSSLTKYEPRIAIRTVTLGQSDTTLLVNITYVIISIQEERRISLGLPLP